MSEKKLQKLQKNKKYKTIIKNSFKEFTSLLQKDKNNSLAVLEITSKIQKTLDKAVSKKIIKVNKAKRLKSRIQKSAFLFLKKTS